MLSPEHEARLPPVATSLYFFFQSGAIVHPSGYPISRSVSSGVNLRTRRGEERVPVVPDSFGVAGEERASDSIASLSPAGRSFPRFLALRMIPCAPCTDSQNLGGAVVVSTCGSSTTEDEHPASSLGHAEELSVQNSEGPPIPEFSHKTEERPKVSARMGKEESRDVLEEDPFRSVSFHQIKEAEGESRSCSSESASSPPDREVLAREPAREESGAGPVFPGSRAGESGVEFTSGTSCQSGDVSQIRDGRPVSSEDR